MKASSYKNSVKKSSMDFESNSFRFCDWIGREGPCVKLYSNVLCTIQNPKRSVKSAIANLKIATRDFFNLKMYAAPKRFPEDM